MNKLLSCRYNTDTNRVEARFEDGTALAIDRIAVEDAYGNTPAQRAELGCEHGRSENRPCTIRRKGRTRANESGLFRVFVGSCAKLW